jgi:hypothetical protein
VCRLRGRGNGGDNVVAVQAVYAVEGLMNVIILKRVCSVLSRVLRDRGERCHDKSRLSTASSSQRKCSPRKRVLRIKPRPSSSFVSPTSSNQVLCPKG